MAALPRRIIVDDIDPQIQYSGGDQWTFMRFPDVPATYPNGPPFQNTTHRTNITSTTSSLSFRFQGSSPQVFGTSFGPAQECFIDGTSIGSTAVSQTLVDTLMIENNDLLCDGTQFVEGREYTLTLNVSTTAGTNNNLFFDYITYIPSASVLAGSVTVLVDRSDSAIAYSLRDWATDATSYNFASFTRTSGSFLTFNFTGTSVGWVGFIPGGPGFPNQRVNGTYSIDDGDPLLILLDGLPGYGGNLSNEMYFTSPNLSPGPHTLKVTNHGGNTTTPFTLNHLVVFNHVSASSLPPSASSSLPPLMSPPLPPAATSTTATNKVNASAFIGGIVGGVVGGIALLCLAAFLWRRNRRRRIGHERTNGPAASLRITPFNAMLSGPIMAEASNRNHQTGIGDPDATPQTQNSNRRKVRLRVPPPRAEHENGGSRNLTGEIVDPPPSYVSL